jgi:hypothetical protein
MASLDFRCFDLLCPRLSCVGRSVHVLCDDELPHLVLSFLFLAGIVLLEWSGFLPTVPMIFILVVKKIDILLVQMYLL